MFDGYCLSLTFLTLQQSLNDLMDQLNAAAPHFVRCIKPNVNKMASTFDDALVLKQLRYTGGCACVLIWLLLVFLFSCFLVIH